VVIKQYQKMNPFENIIDTVKQGKSFILEAGAGSGKTYTLIQTVNYILEQRSEYLMKKGQKIACITFTNIAKDQIIERTNGSPLVKAQTIHEFLWECIVNYQKQLHLKLDEVNKYYSDNKKRYEYIENLSEQITDKDIVYWDYGRRFIEGKISHDDVLLISNFMFRDYKKLSDILCDKHPYLFIDEYQDTQWETIELVLDYHLLRNSKRTVVGFFGDSMQKIYNQGVGSIPDSYIKNGTLEFITKTENFRSSQNVINILNQIRPSLQQTCDKLDKSGGISFVYGNHSYNKALEFIQKQNLLDFENELKTLFLTHRAIASRGDFSNIFNVYNKRYSMYVKQKKIKKDDRFSSFLLGDKGIIKLIENYNSKNYGEFINLLGKVGFTINYHSDKEKIKNEINNLINLMDSKSIGEVFNYIKETSLITIPDKISDFENFISKEHENEDDIERAKRDTEFYSLLMNIPFSEVISTYDYIEENTPFSTKHNTKGDEYKNVLVVIDDEAWKNQYSFDKMIGDYDTSENRFNRTLNLFYVCCSRAKINLVVLALSAISEPTRRKAIKWFGETNVYAIN